MQRGTVSQSFAFDFSQRDFQFCGSNDVHNDKVPTKRHLFAKHYFLL